MLLGLTLMYSQCMAQCCWVLHWEWDYNFTSDAGSYVGGRIIILPVMLDLTLGVGFASFVGPYTDR